MSDSIVSVVVGPPLIALVDLCYEARLSLLLSGTTGIGKSTVLEEYAKSKRIDFLSLDLSIMEPPDLAGLPKITKGRTQFCPPRNLPTAGSGIIVLEELNRAPRYMRAPCLQFLTSRRLNDYVLPAGWLPMACVNPSGAGYDVDELDLAILTRFVQVFVRPDAGAWVSWARAQDIHPDVIEYIESDPTALEQEVSNPRSWEHVSQLLKTDITLNTEPSLLWAGVAGCVGDKRAKAFFKFRKSGIKPLEAEEILESYRSRRKNVRAWIEAGKLDLVDRTLMNIKKLLQSSTNFHAVQKEAAAWKNLGRFLADLPGDLHDDANEFFRERGYALPTSNKRRAN